MELVDLSKATLSFVDFVGLDLTQVVIDEQRQIRFRDWESRRAGLEGEARARSDGLGKAMRALAVLGRGQKDFILDFDFLTREFGEDESASIRKRLSGVN